MIKTAIIGYGYMGEIRHREIDAHPNLELVLVCDNDPTRLSGIHSFDVVRDPQAVLDSGTDLVFVCTPNHLIPPLAIEAMRRGKHVFCEKTTGLLFAGHCEYKGARKGFPGL